MTTVLLALALPSIQDAKPAIALSIYNEGFAVVREPVDLNLKAGGNDVRFTGVTAFVEPESVLLRDPADKAGWRVLEQTFRADVANKQRLLELHEGKIIDFEDRTEQGVRRVRGKIVRAGHGAGANPNDYQAGLDQTLIEVDGKLQFGMPGNPLFPSLGAESILKPTLDWKIHSDAARQTTAELSYITKGLSWRADYNLVVSDKDDGPANLIGVVTVANTTGKAFADVGVKLIAGSVRKVEPQVPTPRAFVGGEMRMAAMSAPDAQVTERAFDEYHLYTLPRPVTLRDEGDKQLDFLRSTLKSAKVVYVLDEQRFTAGRGVVGNGRRGVPETLKVAVEREFDNGAANGLGQPLPKGRMRFHRKDADGRLEFLGEGDVSHTPVDRPVKVQTGHAFDLFAKRVLVNQQMRNGRPDRQTIEATIGNRKKEPATVRVIERIQMGTDWTILEKTHDYTKVDAQAIRFDVTVPPGGETKVNYTVEFRWQ